jgi:hypothetical protein
MQTAVYLKNLMGAEVHSRVQHIKKFIMNALHIRIHDIDA